MNIFFSVGEPSGDRHAAELITALGRLEPRLDASGFGGPAMEAAGCHLMYRLTNLAVMGVTDVVPLLRQFRQLVREAERSFKANPPDAVVLVDFPGFNWWIAKSARRAGVRVFYYLPPQLWAWAPWRVRKVRKYVDHVLSVLPFESRWYAERGIAVDYVGHPFFDEVAATQLDQGVIAALESSSGARLALLPGSRRQEIRHNWPVMMSVVRQLHANCPGVEFLLACYHQSHADFCRQQLTADDSGLPLKFLVQNTSEVIEAATASLMVSGSTSLEMLARTTPTVVLYRCGWSFYLLAKLLVKCPYISLPNLMAGEELMPEFCGAGSPQAHIEGATAILQRWLTDTQAHQQAVDRLTQLRREVYQTGAIHRTAKTILDRLDSPSAAAAA